jgi:hypothetical protein
LRLFGRISDLYRGEAGPDGIPAFTHAVRLIPAKDARIAEVFTHLSKVHPSVACLVDGDLQGDQYAEQLAALATPPRIIVRWPTGWRIEEVIA